MRARLRAPDDVRDNAALAPLLAHYRVPAPGVTDFDDVLLSPRGIVAGARPTLSETLEPTTVRVCTRCRKSLQRGTASDTTPPKFAIANHYLIGTLPDHLADSTVMEIALMSLAVLSMSTEVLRGGAHRVLRSHVAVFDARPSAIVEELPRVLDDANAPFMVIVAGEMTSTQELAARRAHRVRGDRLTALYAFFRANNALYERVSLNGDRVRAADGSETHIFRDAQDAARGGGSGHASTANDANGDDARAGDNAPPLPLAAAMDEDAPNVRQRADAGVAANVDEETLERRAGAVHVARDGHATDESVLETARASVGASSTGRRVPTVVVRRHGALVPDSVHAIFALAFPGRFPYGRGHPDEQRRVPVSVFECVRHYLMLSTRAFARDRFFVLYAFDALARRQALMSATLRCRLPSEMPQNAAITRVTTAELDTLLGYESACRAAAQRNAPVPAEPANISTAGARVLLRHVNAAAAKMWASNQERAVAQRHAFALVARYGNPAVFVTISPKDNGSATIAYLAGELDIEHLAELRAGSLPSTARSFTASSSDSVAGARYFDRVVDVFVETILGFDPSTRRPLASGGIFGHVRAYIGGVETQGDGTLHLHMLVWLYESSGLQPLTPSPSSDIDARHEVPEDAVPVAAGSEDVVAEHLAFIDSLSSMSVPLRATDAPCPHCDHAPVELVAAEAPSSAYQSARRGTAPPTLSHCQQCGTGFGGDALIRASLCRALRELLGDDTNVHDIDAHCRALDRAFSGLR